MSSFLADETREIVRQAPPRTAELLEAPVTVLTDREATLVDRVPTGLLVGGEWRPADSGRTLPVEDPSTGEMIAEVADATVADGQGRARLRPSPHQAEWAATPPRGPRARSCARRSS